MTLRFQASLSFALVSALLPGFFAACSGGGGVTSGQDAASDDAMVPEAGPPADDGGEGGAVEAAVDAGRDAGDATIEPDGGSDAGVDATADAATDGAVEGGEKDAGSDAEVDAGADAGVDAGPSCVGCVVLAKATNPVSLVADATSVYWIDSAGAKSSVDRVPIGGVPDGGAPLVLASNQDLRPYAINDYVGLAVDGTSAYWTTNNFIYKAPIDGSSAAAIIGGGAGANGIAVMGSTIYYTNDATSDPPYGGVYSMPTSGLGVGQSPTLLWGNAGQVAGIAVNASGVFVAQWPYSIFLVPFAGVPDGGAPETISSGYGSAGSIALGPSQIFWTGGLLGSASSGLFSAPQTGVPDGGAPALLSSALAQPNVACDGTNVYWATESEQILEAPIAGVPDGGAPKVLASNQHAVNVIATDPAANGNVYWAAQVSSNFADGFALLQVAK